MSTPRPWAEGVQPTAGELADWLGSCTDAERLDVVQRMQEAQTVAAECFTQNHRHAMEEMDRRRDEYCAGFLAACEEIRGRLAAES